MTLAWVALALASGIDTVPEGRFVSKQERVEVDAVSPAPSIPSILPESEFDGMYQIGEGPARSTGSLVSESLMLYRDHRFEFRQYSCLGASFKGTWVLDGEEIVLTGKNPWKSGEIGEIMRLIPAHMADRLYLIKDYDFPEFCANKRALESGVDEWGPGKSYMGLQKSYGADSIKSLSESWRKREASLPIGRVASVSVKGWVVDGAPRSSISVGDLLRTQAKSGGQLRVRSVQGDQVICEVMPSESGWIPTIGEVVYAEKMISSTKD